MKIISIYGVKAEKAYEGEVKIVKEIIEGSIELKGKYFIGEKLYDFIGLTKEI